MIMTDDEILYPDALSAGLKTARIGKKIIHYSETDSTNTQALLLARAGAADGTVVMAERQTAGRGRMNREWHSPGGAGIYLSLILTPGLPANRLPGLTLVAAVAAAEALHSAVRISVDIKWPNDLLLNKKKICGILTELHAVDEGKNIVIVGIGINVNTPLEMFPGELRSIASSILIETGRKSSRTEIVKSLLERFDHWYGIFTQGGFESVLKQWKSFSGIIGKRIKVEQEGVQITGTVVDLDADGALAVMDEGGSRQMIYSGDVTYI